MASNTEQTESTKRENIKNVSREALIEIKACRLDESDACNISNPITEEHATEFEVSTSSLISPTGCHYSLDHYKQFINSGNNYSAAEVFQLLSKIPPYNGMTDEIKKILENNSVDLSDEALLTWAQSKEMVMPTGTNMQVKNTTGDQNPTKEQLTRAQEQRKEEPKDVFSTKITNDSAPTTFNEKDYTEWLCEVYNGACRKDTISPMIPTSVAVSIALARTGCTNTNIGKFNFWKLPYTAELTSLASDNGMCAFSSAELAANACIKFSHAKNVKDAITELKDKMSESSEEEKQKATAKLLEKIDISSSDEKYKLALDFVKKYSLRDWDSDKNVSEGGHADQNTTNNSKTDSNGSGMQDKTSKVMERVASLLGEKGTGFTMRPVGTDYTEIIKLPKGKTPCEPIYPDYITVGDTVPEWVYSETYAAILEETQKKALAKVGITLEEEESNSQTTAFNQELQNFKDQQFAQWCRDNNITYNDDAGKNEALAQYNSAASTDSKFKDGIYIPDSSSQSTYNALLTKKNSLLKSGSLTSQQYQAFQNSTTNVKSEIQNREGGWNQDSGTYTPSGSGGSATTEVSGTSPISQQSVDTSGAKAGEYATFEATAYTPDGSAMEGGFGTSFGVTLEGKTIASRYLAVDTSVIPLGTVCQLKFPSGWTQLDGEWVAVDTGGAIKGNKVDLMFGSGLISDNVKSANKWGRQNIQLAKTDKKLTVSQAEHWKE